MDVNEELKFLGNSQKMGDQGVFGFGGVGLGGGGQGGCEQRIEVFVRGVGGVRGQGSGWGVRMDVIEELKFLGKIHKKWGGGRGRSGRVGGSGLGVRWM